MSVPFKNPRDAVEHVTNYKVLCERKLELNTYIAKSACVAGKSEEAAIGELQEKRDPEFVRLWDRVREAEAVTYLDHPAVVAKRHMAHAEQAHASLTADVAKRAAAEADAATRMTPSEVELHKRAAALAKEKNLSHGNAMGELMETSKEARDLYRRIDFERVRR